MLDCATSIASGQDRILCQKRNGYPQRNGHRGKWRSYDRQSSDPQGSGFRKKAALAPLGGIGEELGGYKGYGYATVIEVLSAEALQAGSFLKMLTGIDVEGKFPIV